MRRHLPLLALAVFALLAPPRSSRSEPLWCGTPDSLEGSQAVQAVPDTFHRYLPGVSGAHRARRDLEFFWHARDGWDPVLTDSIRGTLDKFGFTLCDVVDANPFGIPEASDFHLVYDYFRRVSTPYSRSLTNNASVLLGKTTAAESYPLLDRTHLDLYVLDNRLPPGDAGAYPAQYPSKYLSALEDIGTGHPALPESVLADNSIHVRAPDYIYRLDPDGNGWTAPGRVRSVNVLHEMQHSLPNQAQGLYSEFLSAGAEVIAGAQVDPADTEMKYTWPLNAYPSSNLAVPPAQPGVGRDIESNYEGRTAFMAYLAYNFRGTDTSATLAAFDDDLMRRWSQQPVALQTLAGLRDLLGDATCLTCAQKSYFAGLDSIDRMALLLHNWRVANYVNNSSLAEGQYGYPPQFGFSPAVNRKAWQSFNGIPEDDNRVIPPEVVLTNRQAVRETTLVGMRDGPGDPYPMTLLPFGSEYWVVRAGPSAWATNQDLVVRMTPEGFYDLHKATSTAFSCLRHDTLSDGRLVASIVAYSPPDPEVAAGQLWQHPEWATSAIAPAWVDVDSAAAALEFLVPGFGSSVKALVIVLSLADGPKQLVSDDVNGVAYVEALPYRLSLGLRRGANLSPNPKPEVAVEMFTDEQPTWSPAGDSLLFVRSGPGMAAKVFRRAVGGTISEPLLPGAPAEQEQVNPVWSPRGDYVALAIAASPGAPRELWVYNQRLGTDLRKLTPRSGPNMLAAFRPDGQRLAYLWRPAVPPVVTGIRTVNLSGTDDGVLFARFEYLTMQYIQWSPDGNWVYFTLNDSLYAVGATGALTGVVVPRAALIQGAARLDLPPGLGPIALEQVTEVTSPLLCGGTGFTCPECPGSTYGMPVHRLALRDTVRLDTEARFFRTSAEFFDPRWSPDGTRIAYSTNQNGPPDRDIYIGQVCFNHAPLLHDVAQFYEMDVYAHVPFSYDFSASDSDGESITFQAVYLPDSATFHPTSGLFSWPNPKKAGADSLFFIVFRALDPSGGVHSYVTRFRVLPQAPGGGGCPFVDVSTADGWITDNSILGRSRTGELGVDAYRLKFTPAVRDGRIRLRLRENEQELTTLDQVRLLAVDHAPSLSMMSAGGELYWGERVPAWRVTTSRGEDITSLVSGQPGSPGWRGSPGDTVLVEMTDPATGRFGLTGTQDGGGGTGEGSEKEVEVVYDPSTGGGRYAASPAGDPPPTPAALTDATWLDRTGIRVQVPDDAGGWQDLTHWYPRANRDDSYFPGLTHETARLILVGRHGLSFFGRLRPKTGAVNQTVLEPLAATHTRLGDARNAIGGTAEATELAPGDSLYLEFAPPPPVEGMVREYFLVTRGVYTSNAGAARLQPQTPKVPGRYALLQNVPNPFAGTTAIQFELPRAERVKLEVFDLLGRRVRTLADGEWPAGYHAVEWDRTGDSGARLRAGVYLYRLTAGSFRDHKKMVIGVR